MARNKVVESSQELDADAAAAPSQSCRVGYIGGNSRRLLQTGENMESCAAKARLLSLPVNNAFVFLTDKRKNEAAAFVELCFSFHASVPWQRLCEEQFW